MNDNTFDSQILPHNTHEVGRRFMTTTESTEDTEKKRRRRKEIGVRWRVWTIASLLPSSLCPLCSLWLSFPSPICSLLGGLVSLEDDCGYCFAGRVQRDSSRLWLSNRYSSRRPVDSRAESRQRDRGHSPCTTTDLHETVRHRNRTANQFQYRSTQERPQTIQTVNLSM